MVGESIVFYLFWAAVFALMMRFGCGAHVMGHRHTHPEPPCPIRVQLR